MDSFDAVIHCGIDDWHHISGFVERIGNVHHNQSNMCTRSKNWYKRWVEEDCLGMKQLLIIISDVHIQISAVVIVYILHLLEWRCKDSVLWSWRWLYCFFWMFGGVKNYKKNTRRVCKRACNIAQKKWGLWFLWIKINQCSVHQTSNSKYKQWLQGSHIFAISASPHKC